MLSNPWDSITKPPLSLERSRSVRLDCKPRIVKPTPLVDSDVDFESIIGIPRITWDDFSAPPDRRSPWAAHTYWDIRYKYRVSFIRDRPFVQISSRCRLNSETSWVKRKDDKLFVHERGHYFIGWICALEFKKRVLEAKLSPYNYANEIEKIFKSTLEEHLRWEVLYDQETEHYKNVSNQLKWNQRIAQKLYQLREYLDGR